jgi:hypothetical protein
VVRENRDGAQVIFGGMTFPEYRTGDSISPGRVVMEIVDTSRVQMRAHQRAGSTSIAPPAAKVRGTARR